MPSKLATPAMAALPPDTVYYYGDITVTVTETILITVTVTTIVSVTVPVIIIFVPHGMQKLFGMFGAPPLPPQSWNIIKFQCAKQTPKVESNAEIALYVV